MRLLHRADRCGPPDWYATGRYACHRAVSRVCENFVDRTGSVAPPGRRTPGQPTVKPAGQSAIGHAARAHGHACRHFLRTRGQFRSNLGRALTHTRHRLTFCGMQETVTDFAGTRTLEVDPKPPPSARPTPDTSRSRRGRDRPAQAGALPRRRHHGSRPAPEVPRAGPGGRRAAQPLAGNGAHGRPVGGNQSGRPGAGQAADRSPPPPSVASTRSRYSARPPSSAPPASSSTPGR